MSQDQEVDFVIGDMDLAVEIKGVAHAHESDLRGLATLRDEWTVRRAVG